MDERQHKPRFRPTIAPPGRSDGLPDGQSSVRFESPEEAEAKEAAFRAFMQPGQEVPLLWEGGVTTLVVKSVAEDGTLELGTA